MAIFYFFNTGIHFVTSHYPTHLFCALFHMLYLTTKNDHYSRLKFGFFFEGWESNVDRSSGSRNSCLKTKQRSAEESPSRPLTPTGSGGCHKHSWLTALYFEHFQEIWPARLPGKTYNTDLDSKCAEKVKRVEWIIDFWIIDFFFFFFLLTVSFIGVLFNGIKYVPNVVQLSPLSICRRVIDF